MSTRSRFRRIGAIAALALAGVAGIGMVTLWSARKPIAQGYIDEALKRRGVPARYTIARLGFRTQILEGVVIGDPSDPDLVADRAEIRFGISGVWPSVTAIRASGVRLRGRIVNGRLSLGAIDRLMPAPSGKSFALPDIAIALNDARMRLETLPGPIGLAMEGKGNLTGGFAGRVALAAPRLEAGGCALEQPRALLHVAIARREPSFDGALRAAGLGCGDLAARQLRAAIDLEVDEALNAWDGAVVLLSGRIANRDYALASARSRIVFKGTAQATDARVKLSLGHLSARSPMSIATALEGTPLAPLAGAIERAAASAARAIEADASVNYEAAGARRMLRIAPLEVRSASGARLEIEANGRNGIGWQWPANAPVVDAKLRLAGGGFPEVLARIRDNDAGYEGRIDMAPYVAGGARLATDPFTFGRGRFATRVRMDGPLADGRVEGLDLGIEGRTFARGGFGINPRCQTLSFARVVLAGTDLGPTRLPLCPLGSALFVRSASGAMGGGAIVAGPRLRGRIGGAPLSMAADRFTLALAHPGFALDRLAIRLGAGRDPTRLDVTRLAGRADSAGLSGTLAGAAGKIGGVPLLVSKGEGGWSLRQSVLKLNGGIAVDDAASDPRFHQLVSRDVALGLREGRIHGTATLRRMPQDARLTHVTLDHDLSAGLGSATLDVPGLAFSRTLQPEMLTRLTLGVIANAAGTVSGKGRIAWSRRGVVSSGDFRTDGMDFAAAFGPVTGLKGTIHFSDLLGLATPPGQEVTIASVNPGVAVEQGRLRYQLLPGQIMKIESGHWPFSGGVLALEPSALDFGRPSERHLTFRIEGMDAAQFVQQFDFKNIAVSGTFDGVLPMIFDVHGGRIEGGRLVVRQGGGTLAYVGEISNAQLGRFGNMAFDALKSIRYSNLAILLDGSLDGEIVSKVIFSGTNEAPVAVRKGLLGGLVGLPFKFNITISAPFRALVNSAQSINDPRGLVKGALEQRRAGMTPAKADVQPSASEPVR